ncbi:MAG: sulfatase-like hydrolase/transferase [Proteobacteria bacterium]|nr:sulfatase-like hydrolase/transferase [Pseudomonadota bacterium]
MPPTDSRDEWPEAARVAAFLYLARLAVGWGAPLGAEELVLDAGIWWSLFALGFAVMPKRPDIWVRLFASMAMAMAAFLSLAGLSVKEAVAGAAVTLVVNGVILGRHAGSPGTAAITAVVGVPVALVLAVRGAPEAMPGIAFLTLLVLLVGHRDMRIAAFLALGASLVGTPERPPTWRAKQEAPSGPDIVLVVADTLRADVAAELETTRRVTRGGGTSLGAVSPSPWTLPSMGTLMTGKSPDSHGAGSKGTRLSGLAPGHPTLARSLRDKGYDTAAVLAENGYLARRFGLLDGLAEVRGRVGRGSELVFRLDERGRRVVSRALRDVGLPVGLWGRSWGVNDAVAEVEFIQQYRRDRPLFLWVHLMETHMPWEHVEGPESALRRELVLEDASPDAAALHRAYREQASALDAGLLKLIAVLGPPPPRGRVFVLTSDHGEEIFEHDGFEHGHAFWEELLRVPLLIQGVDVHPTAKLNRVGLADLHATLLEAAGAEPAGDGRPLQKSVGPSVHRAQGLLYGDRPGYAVWRGRHKLIMQDGPKLYDLAEDPHEQRDLAAELPDLVRSLSAFAPTSGAEGPPVELSAEERRRLEALGYFLPE